MYVVFAIAVVLLYGVIGGATTYRRWRRTVPQTPLLHPQERQRLETQLLAPFLEQLQTPGELQQTFLQTHLAQVPQLQQHILNSHEGSTKYLQQFAERYLQHLDDGELVEFQSLLDPTQTRTTLIDRYRQHRLGQRLWTGRQQLIHLIGALWLIVMLLCPPWVHLHWHRTTHIGGSSEHIELGRQSLGYHWAWSAHLLPPYQFKQLPTQTVQQNDTEHWDSLIHYRRLILQIVIWTILVNVAIWFIRSSPEDSASAFHPLRTQALGPAN